MALVCMVLKFYEWSIVAHHSGALLVGGFKSVSSLIVPFLPDWLE